VNILTQAVLTFPFLLIGGNFRAAGSRSPSLRSGFLHDRLQRPVCAAKTIPANERTVPKLGFPTGPCPFYSWASAALLYYTLPATSPIQLWNAGHFAGIPVYYMFAHRRKV